MRLQKTLLRGVFGPSDLGRWSNASNLLPMWNSRTIQMAALIPAGSRVLDVGAGAMVLKDHLPERCLYTPADLVARSPDTLVWDLNSNDWPDLPGADVVFLSGVLEYVVDLERLLHRLYRGSTFIVASYALYPGGGRRGRLRRRSRGWVNDYSQDALLSLFLHHGFHCEHMEAWYDQGLFRFRKMQIQPAFVRD